MLVESAKSNISFLSFFQSTHQNNTHRLMKYRRKCNPISHWRWKSCQTLSGPAEKQPSRLRGRSSQLLCSSLRNWYSKMFQTLEFSQEHPFLVFLVSGDHLSNLSGECKYFWSIVAERHRPDCSLSFNKCINRLHEGCISGPGHPIWNPTQTRKRKASAKFKSDATSVVTDYAFPTL